MPASLLSLPPDVFLDVIFPLLSTRALLSIGEVNRQLHDLVLHEVIWRRKLADEYNLPVDDTARTLGWRTLYRRMARPKLYVWGEHANGRLGIGNRRRSHVIGGGVPRPMRLNYPTHVVDMIGGAWSFHALDSSGCVWYWGTMHGEHYNSPTYDTPQLLSFNQSDSRLRSISCGRTHALAMNEAGDVYQWSSWDAVNRVYDRDGQWGSDGVTTPRDLRIKAAVAGWAFSAVLTHGGDIFMWWDCESMPNAHAKTVDSIALSQPTFPATQSESSLSTSRESEGDDKPEMIVQIGCGADFIVALSSRHNVFKTDQLRRNGRWQYLQSFCDMAYIARLPVFAASGGLSVPTSTGITHISAHLNKFAAYSVPHSGVEFDSSLVLLGTNHTTANDPPEVLTELQGINVIKICFGDHHSGALTAAGELYTWGAYSQGALGHGPGNEMLHPDYRPSPPQLAPRSEADSVAGPSTSSQPTPNLAGTASRASLPYMLRRRRVLPSNIARALWQQDRVEKPHLLHFPGETVDSEGRTNRFVFNASFAGWHSSALVVSLQEADDAEPVTDSDEDSDEAELEVEHEEPGLAISPGSSAPSSSNPTGGQHWSQWANRSSNANPAGTSRSAEPNVMRGAPLARQFGRLGLAQPRNV